MPRAVAIFSAVIILTWPALCRAQQPDAATSPLPGPALSLLRGRIATAVADERPVFAYARVGASRHRVRLIKISGDSLHARIFGAEVPLAWSHFDGRAIAACARRCLRPADSAGRMALLKLYAALGKSDLAGQVFGELAKFAGADLMAQARDVMKVFHSQAPSSAEVETAQAKSEAKPTTPGTYLPHVSSGRTFHVDAGQGSESGDGSAEFPWKSLDQSFGRIQPGDAVVIGAGIYRIGKRIRFGPAGTGPDKLTVFKAAPGARVILSGPADAGPTVSLGDFVRLERLWIGGKRQVRGAKGKKVHGSTVITPGGRPGRGKQIVGCTLFGGANGIVTGQSEHLLVQGNRFVRTGQGHFAHGIYLSGGPKFASKGMMPNHAIVDNNLFIAGEGYGIHEWHKMFSTIITRNLVARHSYGIVIDGADHLVANNVIWKSKGATHRAVGMHFAGRNIRFFNNVVAHSGKNMIGNWRANTVRRNAFLGSKGYGEAAIAVPRGEERTYLGLSEQEIDEAIAGLERAFSQSVEKIFTDESIEPAFATLRLIVPKSSPLAGVGVDWLGNGKPPHIGMGVPAPETLEGFWSAFRKLGLQEWDRHGKKTGGGKATSE